jgi:DNA methylase
MIRPGDCIEVLPTLQDQYDMVFGGLWANPTDAQLAVIVRESLRLARKVVVLIPVEQITTCKLAVLFEEAGFPAQIDTWVKNQNSHPKGMKAPLDSTQFVLRVKKPGAEWHRQQMPIGKGYDAFDTKNGKETGNDITPRMPSKHNENLGTREMRDYFGGQAPRKSLTGDQPSQPEWLVMKYMAEWTEPLDSVLDFCCGSGTAGTAAKKLWRKFDGYDLDEAKVRMALDAVIQVEELRRSGKSTLRGEMGDLMDLTIEGYQRMCAWARKGGRRAAPKKARKTAAEPAAEPVPPQAAPDPPPPSPSVQFPSEWLRT